MGMKATKHGVRRPRRHLTVVIGLPLGLIVAIVLAVTAILPDHKAAAHDPVADSGSAPAGSPTPTAASPSAAAPKASSSVRPGRARPAPLAGRIRPAVTYHGVATSYDAGD